MIVDHSRSKVSTPCNLAEFLVHFSAFRAWVVLDLTWMPPVVDRCKCPAHLTTTTRGRECRV